MTWRRKVRVSEESYRFSLPILHLLRLHGLLPVKIQRDDSQTLFMQLSPLYVAIAIVFQIFLIVSMYIGVYVDLNTDYEHAVRMQSKTDSFTVLFNAVVSNVTLLFFMLLIPTRFNEFFDYVELINQVDQKFHTQHSKWERRKQFFMCYGWWLVVVGLIAFHYVSMVMTGNRSWMSIMAHIFAHEITMVIVIVAEFEFQFLASSLGKRIQSLNDNLKQFYEENVVRLAGSWTPKKTFVVTSVGPSLPHHEERMDLLMDTYMKLTDAASLQSELLGLAGLISSGFGLMHMVTCMYFLFLECTKKRPHLIAISVFAMWGVFNTVKLLIIGEPWQTCIQQIETTKSWICKLRYSQVGVKLRGKLRTFQIIMGLREVSFSLAGFVGVDRTFVTALLEVSLTYSLILLQSNDD